MNLEAYLQLLQMLSKLSPDVDSLLERSEVQMMLCAPAPPVSLPYLKESTALSRSVGKKSVSARQSIDVLLCNTHLQEAAVDIELSDVISQSRYERLPCLRSAVLHAPAQEGGSHRVSDFYIARSIDVTASSRKNPHLFAK